VPQTQLVCSQCGSRDVDMVVTRYRAAVGPRYRISQTDALDPKRSLVARLRRRGEMTIAALRFRAEDRGVGWLTTAHDLQAAWHAALSAFLPCGSSAIAVVVEAQKSDPVFKTDRNRGMWANPSRIAEPLLDAAREIALDQKLIIDYRLGDAEALPVGDAAFDAVISTFGVMFAPISRALRRNWRGSAEAVDALR
jgi:hypothetical protein